MRLLALAFLLLTGCTTLFRNPSTNMGYAAVRAATATPEEVQAKIQTTPDCGEGRVAMFVLSLPGLSELYQADLWLASQVPQTNEPKYLGSCVLNPFNPENIKQRSNL